MPGCIVRATAEVVIALLPAWDPQMAWSFHKYWDENTTAAIQPYLDPAQN